ncbi:MAG: hypothetical protein GX794_00080 [Acholeplasmataceae bacterium]|nr:hypothetical protein [Acholeplasmataceae bacterium]
MIINKTKLTKQLYDRLMNHYFFRRDFLYGLVSSLVFVLIALMFLIIRDDILISVLSFTIAAALPIFLYIMLYTKKQNEFRINPALRVEPNMEFNFNDEGLRIAYIDRYGVILHEYFYYYEMIIKVTKDRDYYYFWTSKTNLIPMHLACFITGTQEELDLILRSHKLIK